MSIIKVNNLVKEFKQHKRYSGLLGAFRSLLTQQSSITRAVDDISFSIEKGEAVGYLGPNGAGKSTMIKMLTGILVPTSGDISVMGKEPNKHRRENAKKMGVVFGQRSQLWWDLPVKDSFELHRHIYKLSYKEYEHNLAFSTELLGMNGFIMQPVRQLSLGQRMRAEFALALLHDPEILFLDEPTIGLDVIAKDRIREFLRTINRDRNVTIILTTHDMKDIEEICSHMLIVNKGKSIYSGSVHDLKSWLGNQRKIKIEFASDPGNIQIPGTILIQDSGRYKTFSFERTEGSTFELLSHISRQYSIVDVSLQDPDIEEIIRSLYQSLNRTGKSQTDDVENSIESVIKI